VLTCTHPAARHPLLVTQGGAAGANMSEDRHE
jgi:hypothetical protein